MKSARKLVVLLFLLSCCLKAVAGDGTAKEGNSVRFAYDVSFDMNFDNREFSRSGFTPSMTIFASRLTPAVGLSVSSGNGTGHVVMAGIDIMKDFGSSDRNLFRDLSLYYRLNKEMGSTDITLYAGIFPRKAMNGEYSEAFFSDSLRFYDNNLEGLLVQFKRPKARFEIGCDWYGQYGQDRREKFLLFSSGEGKVAPVLALGYSIYVCHFAGSREVKGVVDNILANPYARLDFGSLLGIQELSFRFGWLQGMQNDRRNIGIYTYPCGGEFDVTVRNWNVSLSNGMYYGTDMMPYYNMCDAGGYKYGNRLYLGDPFYRIHDDDGTGPGLYDRLEVAWHPYVSGFLDIGIGARFHFHDFHYSGCQQMVKLSFNLHELLNSKRNK